MIQRLRRVGVGQMAQVLGALYFFLGLIFAVVFWLIASVVPQEAMGEDAALFGTGFLMAMPLLYGLIGVVFGALIAWLYNTVAGWTGGLEFDFE